ncbi:MAG: arylesterase [Gallionella sp.]|jgi:acyl-CoA thioesterase-1|nr:arylesterase [Gallionella sp.]
MKTIHPVKNLALVIPDATRNPATLLNWIPACAGKTAWFTVFLFGLFASPDTAHAEKNILVFGDSLSAGYGIARDASWVSLLQQELRRDHSQFEVVNASISGETTAGGVRRIAPSLDEHHPAIVIIELGANDGLRGYSLSEMRNNLSRIIEQTQHAKAKVLLVGMRLPPNYGKAYVQEFQDTFVQLAKKHRVALLPFLLGGIPAEQFQADNLHPNAAAQAHLMGNVLTALRPLLSR